MATLTTEKEQLDTETQSLEKRKAELEMGNRWIEKTIIESKAANAKIVKENSDLEKRKTAANPIRGCDEFCRFPQPGL